MNNNKLYLIGAFLVLLPISTFAQYILPDFQSQAVNKDELLIRWEPRDLQEWEASLQAGYQVDVYMGTNKNNLILKNSNIVKPATDAEWDRLIISESDTTLQEHYAGAKSLLYMDVGIENELKVSLMEEEGKSIDETIDEFRLGYLVYSITYDIKMIKMAGLGHNIALKDGYVYQVKVKTKNHQEFIFDYDPNVKQKLNVPKMESEFGDKQVTLKWKTPEFKKHFFGYYLAISENGKSFEKVSDMPYINVLDTVTTNPDAQYLKEVVALERNYKDYWLRLRGMNYFGMESTFSSIEKGYGYEIIDVMPVIYHSDQTPDNKAEIKWRVDRKYTRLIDHYAVYRADELDGEYKIVYDSIPANDRMVRVPMEHNRNFFSLAIVPKDGEPIRSFSVFIMGQDTMPPATPANFVGVVDSMGVVTFNWDRNQEEDLWGYKVFYSEYINDEFTPLTASPIQDTFFVDTINLESINDQIHYSIIALDKRNNRSEFSSIISLERPDTIAPTAPLVKRVRFLEDSIKVTWAASSSEDVVVHQIFRREMNEKGWRMISEQTSAESINYFLDTDFEMDKIYNYTVIAKDEGDLTSAPSKALKVQTTSRKAKNAFVGFDVDFDKDKERSSIRWDLKPESDLEEIIVYRGPSRSEISMYKIVEPNSKEIVQDFEDSTQWFFVFKPVFNDGSTAKTSGVITVARPEK